MSLFPYGRAAFAILLLAVLSFFGILAEPKPKPSTLVMWSFSADMADVYRQAVPAFLKTHPGVTIDVETVSNAALTGRLSAAFQADLDVPDLTELEIGSAGYMFRGPIKYIGFVDLRPWLMAPGPNGEPSLYSQMVPARFAPYSSRGCIFGLPQDVHPVMLAYRKDIFDKYGIKAEDLKTWDEFVAAGHKITIPGKQYMIELADGDCYSGGLEPLLMQRDGDHGEPAGYFDKNGNCIFDNDNGVDAMKMYVPMVAHTPLRIGYTTGDFWGAGWEQSTESGLLVCEIAPDWRSHSLMQHVPNNSGKMELMPLPAVAPGERQTTVWGGTMLGITKACKHKELAWEFAKFLYTDPTILASEFQGTYVMPATRSAWHLPWMNIPDPYYCNQVRAQLYVNLADQVPPQYSSPEIDTARAKLSQSILDCRQWYETHYPSGTGVDDAAWTAFVRQDLHKNANYVRQYLWRDAF
ncbi:MAG: ABC transporter substrate-binding protein [Capsulimonadaceae bacterium]